MQRYCYDWQNDSGYDETNTINTKGINCTNVTSNKRTKTKNNNTGYQKT